MPSGKISINLNNLVEEKELFEFAPFRNWHDSLVALNARPDKEIDVKSILIQQVDRFKGNKVGFVKLLVDAYSSSEQTSIPGIVVLRGGSVSILCIIDSCEGEGSFVILTSQPRLAVPSFDLLELPAGMLDGSGEFQGKAAQELYEETGLKFHQSELINLTGQGENPSQGGILTSPGFTDERLHLFYCQKKLPSEKIKELRGKLTGERSSGEIISLNLIPLSEVYTATSDVKVLASMALYTRLH